MSISENLKKKAKLCLDKQSKMPMSPLFNMANVAKNNATGDLKYLQNALDYLTCKAKQKMPFDNDEKEFLKELYEAFWWGGQYKGYKEAAQLANHYVNGEGNGKATPLKVQAEVYKTSIIVVRTMAAMKTYIKESIDNKLPFFEIRCDNVKFRSKKYTNLLTRMNYKTEGKMKANGVLEAAQNNHRLHKTDGHFYLKATTTKLSDKKVNTVWSVDSLYDFEAFEKHDYYTHIPLGKHKLIVSDGLSEYMTQIGVAQAFWYRAEWSELWELKGNNK